MATRNMTKTAARNEQMPEVTPEVMAALRTGDRLRYADRYDRNTREVQIDCARLVVETHPRVWWVEGRVVRRDGSLGRNVGRVLVLGSYKRGTVTKAAS